MLRRTPLKRCSEGMATSARLTVPVFRPKTCAVKKGGCGEKFTPTRSMQPVCDGDQCRFNFAMRAIGKADKSRKRQAAALAKQDKAMTRAKLEAIKPRSHWLKKAEMAVNRYVRARDHGKGCISCHLPPTWGGQWHASHFRSVGAASSIRFHLWNIHRSCSSCNNHKSGNIAEYRPRLISLIGLDRVEWLDAQNRSSNYGREYLQRLAAVMNRKASRTERRHEVQG